MLRRDLLTAEIKKLAEALARILHLKTEGKTEEADQKLLDLLQIEYNLTDADLQVMDETEFSAFLKASAFPAEKLDVLSQILYSIFDPAHSTPKNKSLAIKLGQTYQLLITEHRTINMINLDREDVVKKYLSTNS
ncbi:hypothetical protein DBR11_12320 [Pedobacter sp. HMWF019]|uniref:hypothetical protein n=1 Tax=Pedobacter sp. HMWF019 TaxID=2056856 RepID=UPI000D38C518|nr:hypothetical protein [Pedobacter sp. HMWF019]PTS99459.1 hypothetical protein DBR11_12320 [Pedobacter sp. HMWF019]